MGARQRVVVLVAETAVVLVGTAIAEGRPMSFSPIFLALFGVAMNPLLAEFPYPPTGSAVLSSFGGIALLSTLGPEFVKVQEPAIVVYVFLLFTLILPLWAQFFGANQENASSWLVRMARIAAPLSRRTDSRVVLTPVLLVLLLAKYQATDPAFWWLLGTLAALLVIGGVDWLQVISGAVGRSVIARAEAMIAPSRLVVTANSVPAVGDWVQITSGAARSEGVVITRIPRRDDFWAEIHLANPATSEKLLSARTLDINAIEPKDPKLVGSADVGSTETLLRFVATIRLEILRVVRVPATDLNCDVYYQVIHAELEASSARGGTQLVVRATARQIGTWDQTAAKLVRHRWVPLPGAAVYEFGTAVPDITSKPAHWLALGSVVGTGLPVFLDLREVASGHLAVLGMTKMGKTTLALRIAAALGADRRVVVLDQTGEYSGPLGLPGFVGVTDWLTPGVCVGEPAGNETAPALAERTLREATAAARAEYLLTPPTRRARSLFVDEAHQFVPEPAGMDFKLADRDCSVRFGAMAMQVRKYGISLVLISQRTSVLAKTPLTQCENLIVFRTIDQTGLEYVEALGGADVRTILPALRQGEAVVMGPAFSAELPVAISLSRA
jgi:hypothetical protein